MEYSRALGFSPGEVPTVNDSGSRTTPYQWCERYARGEVTRADLVSALASFPYDRVQHSDSVDPLVQASHSLGELSQAVSDRLIDADLYRETLIALQGASTVLTDKFKLIQTDDRISTDQLAALTDEFSEADQDELWLGYSIDDPGTWASQFGWTVDHLDRGGNLWLHTREGIGFQARQQRADDTRPGIAELTKTVWRGDCERPEHAALLIASAEVRTNDAFIGLRERLGDPGVDTRFDDPAFPDELERRFPSDRRARLHDPLRLITWMSQGRTAELVLIPSIGLSDASLPGSVQLILHWRRGKAGSAM